MYDIVDTFMKDGTTAFDDILVKTLVLEGLNRHKNGGSRGGECRCAVVLYSSICIQNNWLRSSFFPSPLLLPCHLAVRGI